MCNASINSGFQVTCGCYNMVVRPSATSDSLWVYRLPLREIFDVEKTYDRSTQCLSAGLVTSARGPEREGVSQTVC